MLYWLKKFTSRKFLTALLAILGGLVLLFIELDVPQAVEIASKIIGGILALGSVLGYTFAEASVDKAALKAEWGSLDDIPYKEDEV